MESTERGGGPGCEGRTQMIDLTVTDGSPPASSPADRLSATALHGAGRARLSAVDGVTRRYRTWTPVGRPPEASLGFLDGIASHGAWFAGTRVHLAERGIAVYAPDRRGSGLSGGRRTV